MRAYFSLVFQITQQCPFTCGICLRNFDKHNKQLSPNEWQQAIDILKPMGLKRLTISGGEPMLLKQEILAFLEYVHEQEIHTCLSTSGFNIDQNTIIDMDRYLDHLLMSVRSLDLKGWQQDFGSSKYSSELFYHFKSMIQWVKETNIILELSTVVHKKNYSRIIDLGWQILELNPNIVWRVENYYANGIEVDRRQEFEVDDEQFIHLQHKIQDIFYGLFKDIRFRTKESKRKSTDFFLSQNGDLLLTSDHQHTRTEFNVVHKQLPVNFPMTRNWSEYRNICRDWGWGDFN